MTATDPVPPLNAFAHNIYSENGEDGILEAIFRKIGTSNRFGVEFGVEDGSECNTRYLRERQGWAVANLEAIWASLPEWRN